MSGEADYIKFKKGEKVRIEFQQPRPFLSNKIVEASIVHYIGDGEYVVQDQTGRKYIVFEQYILSTNEE